jgi:hypothetical protein
MTEGWEQADADLVLSQICSFSGGEHGRSRRAAKVTEPPYTCSVCTVVWEG